jgi:hypothetical protein
MLGPVAVTEAWSPVDLQILCSNEFGPSNLVAIFYTASGIMTDSNLHVSCHLYARQFRAIKKGSSQT